MRQSKPPPKLKRFHANFWSGLYLLGIVVSFGLFRSNDAPIGPNTAAVYSSALLPGQFPPYARTVDLKKNAPYDRLSRALFLPLCLSLAAAAGLLARLYQRQRALRTQLARRPSINPHFIANTLNAIEHLIQSGRQTEAVKYFAHFSHLSRRFSNTDYGAPIRLSDDLKTLEHFLALAQLRFRHIEYDIRIGETLRPELIQTPAMLLQAYVEEAVWRRLKPKNQPGYLLISIERSGKRLVFQLEDNGLSLEEARQAQAARANIPQERLHKIARVAGVKVEEQNRLNDAGQAVGARVSVSLPLRSYS